MELVEEPVAEFVEATLRQTQYPVLIEAVEMGHLKK
jgi:hypothetical protein